MRDVSAGPLCVRRGAPPASRRPAQDSLVDQTSTAAAASRPCWPAWTRRGMLRSIRLAGR